MGAPENEHRTRILEAAKQSDGIPYAWPYTGTGEPQRFTPPAAAVWQAARDDHAEPTAVKHGQTWPAPDPWVDVMAFADVEIHNADTAAERAATRMRTLIAGMPSWADVTADYGEPLFTLEQARRRLIADDCDDAGHPPITTGTTLDGGVYVCRCGRTRYRAQPAGEHG